MANVPNTITLCLPHRTVVVRQRSLPYSAILTTIIPVLQQEGLCTVRASTDRKLVVLVSAAQLQKFETRYAALVQAQLEIWGAYLARELDYCQDMRALFDHMQS